MRLGEGRSHLSMAGSIVTMSKNSSKSLFKTIFIWSWQVISWQWWPSSTVTKTSKTFSCGPTRVLISLISEGAAKVFVSLSSFRNCEKTKPLLFKVKEKKSWVIFKCSDPVDTVLNCWHELSFCPRLSAADWLSCPLCCTGPLLSEGISPRVWLYSLCLWDTGAPISLVSTLKTSTSR